jgi:hypothetical protein
MTFLTMGLDLKEQQYVAILSVSLYTWL